jgi:protein SCO1/2
LKRKFSPIVLVFIILTVPALIVILIHRGKNHYIDLPYYGNKIAKSKGDTLYHSVPPFSFINQDSANFNSSSLKGKIYVAQFFFTSCQSICPIMTTKVKTVFDHYKIKKDFNVVSFSIDPAIDRPSILLDYRKKFKILEENWIHLTGNRDSIYALMNTKGYLLLQPNYSPDPAESTHTEFIDLVDRQGHIRGMYDATSEKEMDRLMDEIRLLYLKDLESNGKN